MLKTVFEIFISGFFDE